MELAAESWAQEPKAQPILAVLDFTVSGISAGEGGLFCDVLTSHLVRSGAYRVIDRRERDAILKEIEFSVSDCSDERCQRRSRGGGRRRFLALDRAELDLHGQGRGGGHRGPRRAQKRGARRPPSCFQRIDRQRWPAAPGP